MCHKSIASFIPGLWMVPLCLQLWGFKSALPQFFPYWVYYYTQGTVVLLLIKRSLCFFSVLRQGRGCLFPVWVNICPVNQNLLDPRLNSVCSVGFIASIRNILTKRCDKKFIKNWDSTTMTSFTALKPNLKGKSPDQSQKPDILHLFSHEPVCSFQP